MELSQIPGDNPDVAVVLFETKSNRKDASGLPPWKGYLQCESSTKGWRMLVFADGWAASYVEGPETYFAPKK